MTRPITIPVGGPMQLGVDRLKMRRRVMAALLRHGADGVWGACYCGAGIGTKSAHRGEQIAVETGLDETYVREVLAEHDFAAGRFGHRMHCKCGTTYDDTYAGYGREQHLAEAIAAGCDTDMLRAAEAARRAAGGTR